MSELEEKARGHARFFGRCDWERTALERAYLQGHKEANRWRLTSEELPSHLEYVLWCTEDGVKYWGYLDLDYHWQKIVELGEHCLPLSRFTHWLPIEGPEDE